MICATKSPRWAGQARAEVDAFAVLKISKYATRATRRVLSQKWNHETKRAICAYRGRDRAHDLTGIDKTMKHRNEKGNLRYVDGKEFNRSNANGQNIGGPQVSSEMAVSPIRTGQPTGKPKGRSEFCTPLRKWRSWATTFPADAAWQRLPQTSMQG